MLNYIIKVETKANLLKNKDAKLQNYGLISMLAESLSFFIIEMMSALSVLIFLEVLTIKKDIIYSSILHHIIKEKIVIEDPELQKLSLNQIAALLIIYELEVEQKNTVSRISHTLNSPLSSISKILKVLQELSYITRKTLNDDRRNTYVFITNKKLSEIKKLNNLKNHYLEEVYRNFSSKEQEVINRFVETVNNI